MLLGFDALGRPTLGQISEPTSAPPPATPSSVFSQSAPFFKKGIAAAALAFTGFVAPPPPANVGPFSQFAQAPQARTSLQPFTNAPLATFVQPYVFSVFSRPALARPVIASFTNPPQPALFQPYVFSAFAPPLLRTIIPQDTPWNVWFDVEPPPSPPFVGFAMFAQTVHVKPGIVLFTSFVPPPISPDTHDGVWVKRKRKKPGPDPIEQELAEKASRRAALELAVYGPEVEYQAPPMPFAAPAPAAPDVSDLARVIALAQVEQYHKLKLQTEQDDEDDLEAILREIL